VYREWSTPTPPGGEALSPFTKATYTGRARARPCQRRHPGRRVIAFLSDNHLDPDLAAEAVVLEGDT
jgi:hypothetical protein